MWPTEWCHDVTPLCAYVCVQHVYHKWTHTHIHRANTTSATSLHYPSLDSVALFPSQNYHISSPSKYTPHPSLSTQRQWGRNPSFGRGERGISSLASSQRGNNCRESFTNWPLNLLKRQRNRATENDRREIGLPTADICAYLHFRVLSMHICAYVVSASVYVCCLCNEFYCV